MSMQEKIIRSCDKHGNALVTVSESLSRNLPSKSSIWYSFGQVPMGTTICFLLSTTMGSSDAITFVSFICGLHEELMSAISILLSSCCSRIIASPQSLRINTPFFGWTGDIVTCLTRRPSSLENNFRGILFWISPLSTAIKEFWELHESNLDIYTTLAN